MGEGISAILPQALGAAISPVPIIAIILMLFTAKARVNAPLFTLGWILGLFVVAGIAYSVGDNATDSSDGSTSNWPFIVKIVLGVLMLFLAVRQWSSRPKPGDAAQPPPKWMSGIDQFSPVKAFGLGALLSGLNPKNLLLSVAAGTSVAQLGTSAASGWIVILSYALIGTLTIGGPVVYFFVAGDKAEAKLNALKAWLGENNATVMMVLFAVLGIVLLSDGLQGLSA